eukprot:11907971-Ditylum_brightwellii.AAC.1
MEEYRMRNTKRGIPKVEYRRWNTEGGIPNEEYRTRNTEGGIPKVECWSKKCRCSVRAMRTHGERQRVQQART